MNKNTKLLIVGAGIASLIFLATRDQRKKMPTIFYVDFIPGGFNGICLPPFGIYITKDQQSNTALLQHEMIHWQQYQRMGIVPYYYEYMKAYFIHGYDLHPMEQEARENEDEFCRVNYTQCVRDGRSKTAFNPKFRTS